MRCGHLCCGLTSGYDVQGQEQAFPEARSLLSRMRLWRDLLVPDLQPGLCKVASQGKCHVCFIKVKPAPYHGAYYMLCCLLVEAEHQSQLGKYRTEILTSHPKPSRLKFSSLDSSRSDRAGLASTNVVLLRLSTEKRKRRLRGMGLEKDLVVSKAEFFPVVLLFSEARGVSLQPSVGRGQ